MKITCEVIKDLLPLYHDHVCCEDSRILVEEHLKTCESCRKELNIMDTELKIEHNIEDVKTMKKISKRWKQDKISSFLIGIMFLSVLSAIGCGVAYNAHGSYIAADGTLVEAFGFIPLGFLASFIALLSFVIFVIIHLVRFIHKKR